EFAEGSAVDVGVEVYRQRRESRSEGADDIDVLPALLGRLRDEAVGRRPRIEVEGPKRSNAEGAELAVLLFLFGEPIDDSRERASGVVARGELDPRAEELVRSRPDRADELGAAGFHRADEDAFTSGGHATTLSPNHVIGSPLDPAAREEAARR